MIDISERAQQHFLRLLSQQGIDGLGIRLRVTSPGTPAANCELEFCEPVDLAGGEWTIECAGFEFHVDGDSASWLDPGWLRTAVVSPCWKSTRRVPWCCSSVAAATVAAWST